MGACRTLEDNKRIVARFVEELWNERKLEVADAIFDEDCHTHQLQSGQPVIASPRDPAAAKAEVTDWLSGFSNLKFTVEQMFADRDRIISQLAMDGTQTGQWMGIPPTGKRVNIRMITIHRIRKGKIIEDWVLVEWLGLLQQLGALPPTKDILSEFAKRQKTPA
jgi:predicted ester cyclase